MKWIQYQIQTTTACQESVGELLSEFDINGYEISDHVSLSAEEEAQMYTDIPAELPPDDGLSTITFYTEIPGDDDRTFYSTGSSLRDAQLQKEQAQQQIMQPDQLITALSRRIEEQRRYLPMEIFDITYSVVDDTQWKEKWKENFKPFRIADDILIKPSWEPIPEDCSPEDIIVQIDPGSAFGTGIHETTRLCLSSLRKYITSDTTILDAGCGSGILAISALLCGAGSAFCLDIDPAAVTAARENATLNEIAPSRITSIHANILEDGQQIKAQSGTVFDIAVANILADVIIPLSDHIGEYLKPQGLFISSGILAEKADGVQESIERNDFEILERNILGEWVSFVARKKA
ncbi:MAG: 50S ribosomal protein L11 methyltransferase [Lachnospiraceae bacterium]|nr:50S ribosomal protein L11 methyltransferase [Lachnospiraceae bacterium]